MSASGCWRWGLPSELLLVSSFIGSFLDGGVPSCNFV
jgi:hypothetical protein